MFGNNAAESTHRMTLKHLLVPCWSTTSRQNRMAKTDIEDLRPSTWSFGKQRTAQLRPMMILRLVFAVTVASCMLFFTPRFSVQAQLHKALHEGGTTLDSRCMNRTLGFEKVIAISSGTSWRVDGLSKASEYSGFDVTVVPQPQWSSEEVDVFRGHQVEGRHSEIGPGQARCWLGHLNAIHYMLTSGLATALLVEDDADWDVAIKDQLSMVAPLIRSVSNSTLATQSNESPYGDAWDLLWLGHCGDLTPSSGVEAIIDQTLPESAMYRQVYGERTFHPPHLRTVHRSMAPTCTYAYAITARAGLKIYQGSTGGRDRIITKDLRKWCQDGTLSCVTVNPELFHHHQKAGEPSSEIAVVEGWDDLAAPAAAGYTANIRHSARCSVEAQHPISCGDQET